MMDIEFGQNSVILFKRNALGNIIFWTIDTDGIKDRSYHGRYPMTNDCEVIVRDHTKTSFKSEIKRKKDRGYKSELEYGITPNMYESANQLHDLLDNVIPKFATDSNNADKPMKCQTWTRNSFDYSYGALADPKINGVRCTIKYETIDNGLFEKTKEVVIRSKEGLRYNIKHIEDAFINYVYDLETNQEIVFDGELYIYGEKNTTIGGAARNPKNPLHKYLQFINFDLSIPYVCARDRFHMRRNILKSSETRAINIKIDDYFKAPIFIQNIPEQHEESKCYIIVSLCSVNIKDDSDVETYRDRCILAGYEGCVVRDQLAHYQFGSRPKIMMKAKKHKETECFCIDVTVDVVIKEINGIQKQINTAKFICRNDLNDNTFDCKPTSAYNGKVDAKFTSEYILSHRDEFIGKMLAIKFYERTDKKIPFNANVFGVRDYEINNE